MATLTISTLADIGSGQALPQSQVKGNTIVDLLERHPLSKHNDSYPQEGFLQRYLAMRSTVFAPSAVKLRRWEDQPWCYRRDTDKLRSTSMR
jgi:hypothetical protein